MKTTRSKRRVLAVSALISLLIIGGVRVLAALIQGTDIVDAIGIAVVGLVIGCLVYIVLTRGVA